MKPEKRRDVIDVVMRCRNEMPYARKALAALRRQRTVAVRVLFIDCGSTDGSRDEAIVAGATLHDLRPEDYIPGAVLNLGMRRTRSAIVAFINADAIAETDEALATLIAPLRDDPRVAATYGRQTARPDADARTRADYERAFGDEPPPLRHGGFFSMAASAVRRDVWERLPFDEQLRYSEDVDWTTRAAALGWEARYVPAARFEHSHAYDTAAHARRRKGEGTADTLIHRLGPASVVQDLLRPIVGSILRDARGGQLDPRALVERVAQGVGYYGGRRAGSR